MACRRGYARVPTSQAQCASVRSAGEFCSADLIAQASRSYRDHLCEEGRVKLVVLIWIEDDMLSSE